MPCTYVSRSVFQTFEDQATLDKALARLDTETRRTIRVNGLTVNSRQTSAVNALKQAYQVEAAKLAARKKGYFITEKKLENGQIKLTVRR